MRLSESSSRLEPRAFAAAGGALVAVSLWALPSHGAKACELEVAGTMTETWRDAVQTLEPIEASDGDCATLRLSPTDDGARLTFVTGDGRSAERELREPSELGPTVEALLVTGVARDTPVERSSSETAAAPEAPAPVAPPAPAPSVSVTERHPADASANPPELVNPRPGARFALALGARGGAHGLYSPVLAAFGALGVGKFELGVWGQFEFQYFAGGDGPAPDPTLRPPMPDPESARLSSAVAAGIFVGRRLTFRRVSFVGSGRLGLAALQHTAADRGEAELRVGAGLGAVFPPSGSFRLRTDVMADLVPHDLGGTEFPDTPWWALSGLVGVEVGGT